MLSNVPLNEWERVDDLQYKGLKIIQDTRGFCFGIDAVLLANFADVKKGNIVLDMGTGTGIIPILIAGKSDVSRIVGLEIQAHMAEMSARSVILNNLQDRVQIVEGDLREGVALFGAAAFDVITCNPPYMNSGGGLTNPNDAKAISRHEIKCTLEDVITVSSKLLKIGGKFNMVHRPERLVDIIWLMRNHKLEPKRLRFVHPSPGKKANLILIEGARGGNPQLKMMEPLYVYNDEGEYSEEINAIYNRNSYI
ncbi:MAG: tRNA1Val (adenine37-N6)-methyltransferase [Petroclostridium sp.]|jgi:tRNA1(Val) A37 N6-methylase TrmN6|uniref:tRNA1(Val) (adenine(37)-N6)-methyltransferase n=1 Tax=Petroclostridium xylanilyticum TaxID=1792311 RepID=UPI000B9825C1|nr:tRNA1(Val) (adenine(37)-N6)-methyltransferase [Petroclostridium xylanilyticum]MBZ4646107.1 Methyltransferase type 11 [Clostridia bacterium]MDK2810927.1 tRNA1Val (adenine37-N6)-methyltransferase [Petroclostridium sp.]